MVPPAWLSPDRGAVPAACAPPSPPGREGCGVGCGAGCGAGCGDRPCSVFLLVLTYWRHPGPRERDAKRGDFPCFSGNTGERTGSRGLCCSGDSGLRCAAGRQRRAQPAGERAQPPFSSRGSLGVCVQDRVHQCPSLPAAWRELHTARKRKQNLKVKKNPQTLREHNSRLESPCGPEQSPEAP